MKFFVNTRDRSFYTIDGASLPQNQPQIPYKSRQEIVLQLCTSTPDANYTGVRPETDWPEDTSFDLPGVSAILSVDSDFKRRNKGSLTAEISSGALTSVTGTFSGVTASSFRVPGTVRIFDTIGNAESLNYTNIEITNSNVTFILSENSSLKKSYEKGSVMDAPDSLYMQSALNAEKSSPATGLFVFDLVADSMKLREAVEYSSTSVLSSIAGMELLIFTAEKDGTLLERNSFVCDTVSVTGTIGDPDSTVSVPDLSANALSVAVSSLLAQGFIVEYSSDQNEWHSAQKVEDRYLRFRFVNSSETSESWVVFRMQDGSIGPAGYTPVRGTDYWTEEDISTIKSYVDEAIINGEW